MYIKTIVFWAACFVLVACKKNEDSSPTVVLPASYNFTNVNFEGQTKRLAMLAEMVTEMKKGTIQQLDSNKLLNMYANTNNEFSSLALNTSGKQLRDKTYSGDITFFELLLKKISATSSLYTSSTNMAGMGGVATSTSDASKKYLVDEHGVEYAQVIQKGLMSAIFYYRIAEEYTTSSKLNFADNENITIGEGTEMQHYWDEAFGYVGIPTIMTSTNYDSLKTVGLLSFYGSYMEKAKILEVPKTLLHSLIEGRDAINRKDYSTRDKAGTTIRKNMEIIQVCSAISYLNQGYNAYSDYAVRCHTLSEAYGFLFGLKYNSGKVITTSEYTSLCQKFFDEGSLSIAHISLDDIEEIRTTLSNIYGLNDIKNLL